jgi:hypothetical protein
MTHPETSGAAFLALTEHRHRMAVEACGCGWAMINKRLAKQYIEVLAV